MSSCTSRVVRDRRRRLTRNAFAAVWALRSREMGVLRRWGAWFFEHGGLFFEGRGRGSRPLQVLG